MRKSGCRTNAYLQATRSYVSYQVTLIVSQSSPCYMLRLGSIVRILHATITCKSIYYKILWGTLSILIEIIVEGCRALKSIMSHVCGRYRNVIPTYQTHLPARQIAILWIRAYSILPSRRRLWAIYCDWCQSVASRIPPTHPSNMIAQTCRTTASLSVPIRSSSALRAIFTSFWEIQSLML